MSAHLKPDADLIIQHLKTLEKSLEKSRSWWPRFLFHFTNIDNAVKILESGFLMSRAKLEQTGEMETDNASPMIIGQTDDRWKEYVRLYFRPRTPTQYRNEGFRPKTQRSLNAHCPVPIYFLFDARKMLARKNVYFSKGTLASRASQIYHTAKSFMEIPFDLVYHDTYFDESSRDAIIYHRQAEAVVYETLDLKNLRYIFCRSEAEYQTLVHLLDKKTFKKYEPIIGHKDLLSLYFKKWLYIDKVSMDHKNVSFYFSLPDTHLDPISIRVVLTNHQTGKRYEIRDDSFVISKKKLVVWLDNCGNPNWYTVKLYFDDQIVYSNEYHEDNYELPY